MLVSIVVAVYRNEGSITQTYNSVFSIFASELTQHDFELIFVDDGSDDNSLQEAIELHRKDNRIKVITFTRNFGQMSAMLAGFKQAKGDAVINLSADMQDPVELFPEMVTKWLEGSKIVICHRKSREDNLAPKIFSNIAYFLLRLSLPQMPDGGFDYVLMDREVMDTFNATDVRHRFFQGDLLWSGYSTCLIPYTRRGRKIGKSQYNFSKKLKNFIDAFLDVSYIPIRFISLLGMLTSIAGIIHSITIVISWMQGDTPFDGWAPIMMAILLIGGIIMIMLGVIGEYIWRINEEVRKRPNYIIKDEYL